MITGPHVSYGMKLKALATAAALCCTLGLAAQDAGSSASADKLFLKQADEGNSAEIAASKMALKKSKNPDVKAYAQKMIDDHMTLRQNMASFDQAMGVMTPQPLNPTHREVAKRLAALSGKSFDKAYIEAMDQDHHKTEGMFQNEIATTQNADLKAAVQQGVTVIHSHTEMADQLASQMGLPAVATPGAAGGM